MGHAETNRGLSLAPIAPSFVAVPPFAKPNCFKLAVASSTKATTNLPPTVQHTLA